MESSRKSGLSRVSKTSLGDPLCHVATWSSHVATSKFHLSATSRRGFPTWRRHFSTTLSRRDVRFHVATSFAHLSVTSRRGFTRRDVIFDPSLPRRDVDLHVATSIGTALCHVATWPRTSRRQLVLCSVTSRREPERRDVGLFALCHVATSPRTSRRDPVFSPRIVHFGHSPHAPSLTRTLAPLRPILHRTCRSPHPTGRRPSTTRRPL